jgi:predicted enzyme related to lactoylglutathione lyase
MEMKLELIPVPVSDVDKALSFYVDKVGFHLDHDHKVSEDLRFIQLTPPGSACSITIGKGIATDMKPGSLKNLQMVVKDAQAAHDELASRGVEVTDPVTMPWGIFVYFSDPDGNSWALQQILAQQ